MYISLENDPLLFVQGPPVYRHIKKASLWQEESTSIFPEPNMKDFEEDDQVPVNEQVVKAGKSEKEDKADKIETDPVMWKRLRFLSTEFAQYVYKPLRFELQNGEQIFGSVNELYPSSVQIKCPDDEVVAVEIQEIQEIWWGGKILPIRF